MYEFVFPNTLNMFMFRNDRDRYRSSGGLFEKQGPIKALMAPENLLPPRGMQQSSAAPPWSSSNGPVPPSGKLYFLFKTVGVYESEIRV